MQYATLPPMDVRNGCQAINLSLNQSRPLSGLMRDRVVITDRLMKMRNSQTFRYTPLIVN